MPKQTLFLLVALAAAIVAMITVKSLIPAKRLNEPVRSSFYFACVGSGTPVTECMCLEKEGVLRSGISHIKPKGDDEAAAKFIQAVQAAQEDCKAATLKEIANDLDEAAQAVIENDPVPNDNGI